MKLIPNSMKLYLGAVVDFDTTENTLEFNVRKVGFSVVLVFPGIWWLGHEITALLVSVSLFATSSAISSHFIFSIRRNIL